MSNENQNFEASSDASVGTDVVHLEAVDSFSCIGCKAEIESCGILAFSKVVCPACGAENEIPAKLDHFVLEKCLGSGGMGSVYLAKDTSLGRPVAIKMMQKSISEGDASFDTFRNEAQSAAKLNHPNVAQVYSFGQKDGCPYLAMELITGSDLEKYISDGIKLDPAFVMRTGLEIAEGLRAAEGVGLFHGDIKPENILFDDKMNAKLVDFGIASLASQGSTNELWGTPYYIAPEKVQKKKNSARSDIYSLGATLYHAITGQPPYEGEDAIDVIKARFKGPPRPLEELRTDVEPEVARIIGRMMYNDLFMRYPNYGSLINDIKNYLASIPAGRKQGPYKAVTTSTRAVSSSGVLPTVGTDAAASSAPVKKGKKIIIQKNSMSASVPVASAPSPVIQGDYESPVNSIEQGGELPVIKPKSSVNGLKVAIITIGVVVLLLILGVVGWLGHKFVTSSRVAKQSAAQVVEAGNVSEEYFGLQDEINSCTDRMTARDAEMEKILKQANAVVRKAVDADLVIPNLEPPAPVVELPSVEEAPPVADTAVAATDAAPAPAKPKFDPEWEKKAREALASVDDNPGDEMIAIMVKKLQKEAGFDPNAVIEPVVEAAPEQTVTEDSVAESEPVQNTGLVQLQGVADKYLLEHAKSIRAGLRRCEAIMMESSETFGDVKAGLPPTQIENELQKRQDALAKRTAIIADMNTLIEAADKALLDMKRGLVRMEQAAQRFIIEKDNIARANAEAQRKAEEESRIAAEKAKADAVADEEAGRVRSVFASKTDLINEFDYDRVIFEMQRMEKELATDKGKEELKWTIDRVQRLQSLQKFLIEDIRKHGEVRKGYQNRDIRRVSADGTSFVTSPINAEVKIATLTVADWIMLIRKVLEVRPYERQIDITTWGDQLFNAAIFCYVHGGGNLNALQMAQSLRDKALSKKTSLKFDSEKLLPIGASEAPAEEGFTF